MMAQAIALGKRPHIVVGTPGRVVDHLSNTKVRKGVAGGGRGGRQKARGGGKGEGGGKGILLGQQGDKKTGGEGSNVPYIVAPACGVANCGVGVQGLDHHPTNLPCSSPLCTLHPPIRDSASRVSSTYLPPPYLLPPLLPPPSPLPPSGIRPQGSQASGAGRGRQAARHGL